MTRNADPCLRCFAWRLCRGEVSDPVKSTRVAQEELQNLKFKLEDLNIFCYVHTMKNRGCRTPPPHTFKNHSLSIDLIYMHMALMIILSIGPNSKHHTLNYLYLYLFSVNHFKVQRFQGEIHRNCLRYILGFLSSPVCCVYLHQIKEAL